MHKLDGKFMDYSGWLPLRLIQAATTAQCTRLQAHAAPAKRIFSGFDEANGKKTLEADEIARAPDVTSNVTSHVRLR